MKNYPLIRKVMDHIDAHPEEHDQDHWGVITACGTTMCFAGHAAVMTGATPIWLDSRDGNRVGDNYFVQVRTPDGHIWDVDDYATEQLGLTFAEAGELFYNCDTRGAVRRTVEELLAQEARDSARQG